MKYYSTCDLNNYWKKNTLFFPYEAEDQGKSSSNLFFPKTELLLCQCLSDGYKCTTVKRQRKCTIIVCTINETDISIMTETNHEPHDVSCLSERYT